MDVVSMREHLEHEAPRKMIISHVRLTLETTPSAAFVNFLSLECKTKYHMNLVGLRGLAKIIIKNPAKEMTERLIDYLR